MTGFAVLAVDGGNSKTDVALMAADGSITGFVRGPTCSADVLGQQGSIDTLDGLIKSALSETGQAPSGPVAQKAVLALAGVDFPDQLSDMQQAVQSRRWATDISILNDTFALLRAGSQRGWGVAVVCGAGINCVAAGPDGRRVRFAAQGALSGDWGGGDEVGLAALGAAVRSEEGRGPKTSLERLVAEHFDLETPLQVTRGILSGRLARDRLRDLAPLALNAAPEDPVAAGIRDRLASEVATFARTALARLDTTEQVVEVVLGGGLFSSDSTGLVAAVRSNLRPAIPPMEIKVSDAPPIVGAALLAFDALGSTEKVATQVSDGLSAAVASVAQTPKSRPL